jgi:hypothetical protein
MREEHLESPRQKEPGAFLVLTTVNNLLKEFLYRLGNIIFLIIKIN